MAKKYKQKKKKAETSKKRRKSKKKIPVVLCVALGLVVVCLAAVAVGLFLFFNNKQKYQIFRIFKKREVNRHYFLTKTQYFFPSIVISFLTSASSADSEITKFSALISFFISF